MKRALFPGSFDPFTIGHADIVRRALPLFDEVIIAVGINHQKQPLFPLEERLDMIRKAFASEAKVRVVAFDTLTVDLAKQQKAQYLIRGIRSVVDFEYERTMADANRELSAANRELSAANRELYKAPGELSAEGIETVVFFTRPELAHVSSSFVRDLASHGHDITPYLA